MKTLLLALLALLAVPAAPADAQDRSVALATFDSAWSRVRSFHYDSTFGGLDWNAVRAELRPRVESSQEALEVRSVIREMIARIGVSHYVLIPREVSEALDPTKPDQAANTTPADAGLELRAAGDRVVVWRVEPDGPAARAGLAPGAIVARIGSYDPVKALGNVQSLPEGRDRQLALTRLLYGANGLLHGAVGDTVTVVVAARGGDTARVPLVLRASPGRLIRFANLPASVARVTHRREPANGGCVGVIAFTTWLAPIAAEIDAAVDQVRDCRGIILDLRGNPGGMAGMVMGVGGHFVDSTHALGVMKMRSNELRFVVNPRRVNARGETVRVFGGPLAILVDPMTASTSEIFAAGLQAIGRARIFGEVSAGQALPALAGRLPNGDVLMHAIADYTVVDGSRVEGRGVVPDEAIPVSIEALRAGSDAPLDAARRWILSTH